MKDLVAWKILPQTLLLWCTYCIRSNYAPLKDNYECWVALNWSIKDIMVHFLEQTYTKV